MATAIKLSAGALKLLQILGAQGPGGELRLGGRANRGLANSARALERHGLVDCNDFMGYRINEAGRKHLAEVGE